MPDYQVTFIFDLPGHGFTESYWKNFSSDSLDTAYTNALELGQRRLFMCGEQTVLQGIRISDGETEGRVGKTFYVGQKGYADKGSMASALALNVLLSDSDAKHNKMVQFRGCWDEVELTGGAFDRGNTLFQSGFNSWKQYLLLHGYGWRSIFQSPQYTVLGYTSSEESVVLVELGEITAPLGAPGKLKRVRFSGINNKSRINGKQVIRVKDDFHVELAKPLALGDFVTGGFMYAPSYTIRAASSATIQRLGKRQAGAPLLRSRGRASAKPRV